MAQTTVAGGFIDADLVSAQTALTSGLVSTDELIISDAGVLKRMDVSVLESYLVTNLGDNNIDVAQSSHGFAVGDILRMTTTNNTYAKALADTAANAEVIGVVIDVTDANNFTYATSGEITVAAAVPNSTTAGDIVFLSTSSAGGVQTTEPSTTNQISKPIAIITEANNKMVLVPFRGEIIGGGATSFAPVDATYVTLGTNGTLSGERVLTGGSGITLTDAGANGAATISVTSLGITGAMMAANTITGDKIAVGSDTQGDVLYYNGTDYVRLAADNGKYLRSNGNSANPSWETVSGTTINTNADNRIITGSGTANTLNGETGLTFSAGQLTVDSGATNVSAIVSIEVSASATSDPLLRWREGSGNGDANNQQYEAWMDVENGQFRFRSQNIDGSSSEGDIWTVNDGTNDVKFNGEVKVTEGSATPTVNHSIAKAWVAYDYSGGTPTILGSASYNVGSLGDDGTGHVQINFTNNMNQANHYVCVVTAGATAPRTAFSTLLAASADIKVWNSSDSAADLDGSIAIFGVLA